MRDTWKSQVQLNETMRNMEENYEKLGKSKRKPRRNQKKQGEN